MLVPVGATSSGGSVSLVAKLRRDASFYWYRRAPHLLCQHATDSRTVAPTCAEIQE